MLKKNLLKREGYVCGVAIKFDECYKKIQHLRKCWNGNYHELHSSQNFQADFTDYKMFTNLKYIKIEDPGVSISKKDRKKIFKKSLLACTAEVEVCFI